MRIVDSLGMEITCMDDWSKLYETSQNSHHWKKGRSAYSVAEFLLHNNGGSVIAQQVSEALGERIEFDRAVPEYEVRFDGYGKGRIHDVGFFAQTEDGKSIFVGVEAKVDESFGPMVRDSYLAAKAKQIAGISTNLPERIENLLALHFREPDISMFDIRYQLLYATAGTLAAESDISVLFIAVFKTELYDETIATENYKDYIQFMEKTGAIPINLQSKKVLGHEIKSQGKSLTCLYECFEMYT
jgi:hypothetical protein